MEGDDRRKRLGVRRGPVHLMRRSRAHWGGHAAVYGGVRPTLTPQTILGSKLVGFIDAEDNSKITNVSNAVSAYADIISAASYAQSVAGSRPAITTNAVTGRQIFRFDGVNDCLEFTGIPTGLPTGATAGEIIAVISQEADASLDSGTRVIVGWGTTAATGIRVLRRTITAAPVTNQLQLQVGDGSVAVSVTQRTPVLSGNHLVRGVIDGSVIYADVDGVDGASSACVPNTGTTRIRIGANTAGTASLFHQGDMSALLFTNAVLTAAEFNAIAVWAGPRIWG